MKDYDKRGDAGIFFELLGEKFENARRHAPRVMADALASNEMNPSTALHELVDFLETLSVPQSI